MRSKIVHELPRNYNNIITLISRQNGQLEIPFQFDDEGHTF